MRIRNFGIPRFTVGPMKALLYGNQNSLIYYLHFHMCPKKVSKSLAILLQVCDQLIITQSS